MERLQELIQRTETIQKVNALQQNVAKQLFTYPILGKKEKTKRRIRKYLLFQQIPPVDRFYWPNALLARGLSEVCRGISDNVSINTLERYFNRWIKQEMPIYYVDNITNGIPLLDLYERTGNEKYMTGAQRLAAYLLKYPADSRGESSLQAEGWKPYLCRWYRHGLSFFMPLRHPDRGYDGG